MSQERDPAELSAKEIANRIGAIEALPHGSPPPPVSAADAYHARLVAVQRALSQRTVKPTEPPPVGQVSLQTTSYPEPRVRLIRDSAATLVGFAAVALIVIAVWPPSPNGGVLGATATPTGLSATATAPSTPEPTPTPTPKPTLSFEP